MTMPRFINRQIVCNSPLTNLCSRVTLVRYRPFHQSSSAPPAPGNTAFSSSSLFQDNTFSITNQISKETLFETSFYCQHRPLAFHLYNECASLFQSNPSSSSSAFSAVYHKQEQSTLIPHQNHFDPWDDIMEIAEPSDSHNTQSHRDIVVPDHHQVTIKTPPARHSSDEILAINILKIRRKKMNKHKLKKRRRKLRFDTRYNREMQKRKKKALRRRPFDPTELEEDRFKDFKREV